MPAIGHRIERLEAVPSTNSYVLEREDLLATHGLVVTAQHQTAGRGRMGRAWASVPGAQLQFSAVMHPPLAGEAAALMALLAGLAVAEGVEAATGVQPRLKWPNDVYAQGRKLCGILVENRPGAGGQPRLVVGIGINGQGRAADYGPELAARMITLAEAAEGPVDNEAVLQAVLARLEHLHQRLGEGARGGLLDAWRARADLAGRRVHAPLPGGPQALTAVDVAADGSLLADDDTGTRHTLVSGNVTWLD